MPKPTTDGAVGLSEDGAIYKHANGYASVDSNLTRSIAAALTVALIEVTTGATPVVVIEVPTTAENVRFEKSATLLRNSWTPVTPTTDNTVAGVRTATFPVETAAQMFYRAVFDKAAEAASEIHYPVADGRPIKRLPFKAPAFVPPANCVHYFGFDSLTDAVTGVAMTTTLPESYVLTSNGYGYNSTGAPMQFPSPSVAFDPSGDWTMFFRAKLDDHNQDSALVSIFNASNNRSFQIRSDNGRFRIATSATGVDTIVNSTTTASKNFFGGVEYLIECSHTAAGRLILKVNGITEIDVPNITIYNPTDKAMFLNAIRGWMDELFIFDAALDIKTDRPDVWNGGRGLATEFDYKFAKGFQKNYDPIVTAILGQSNGGLFNTFYTNETSHLFPEFGAGVAYYREEGTSTVFVEQTEFGAVGPYPSLVANSVGVLFNGMGQGIEVGYSHGLLERGFTDIFTMVYIKGGSGAVAGQGPKDWSATGDMWIDSQPWIDARLAEIAASTGEPANLQHIIWFQGEAEAYSATASVLHKAAVVDLFTRIRAKWGADIMITVALPWDKNRPHIETVRQGLIEIGSEMENINLVETKFLRRQDNVHLAPEGQDPFGRKCAEFISIPKVF